MKDTAPSLPWFAGFLPVIAVLIGMYGFDAPLIAVAIYHPGMVLCLLLCKPQARIFGGAEWKWLLGFSAACLLTGPVIYFLWPWMELPGVSLPERLAAWGLTGRWSLVFVVFSITLHPVLEEGFWRGRMPQTPLSDALFALFHVFVLLKIVHWPWALVSFGVLAASAWSWRWIGRRTGGLLVPVVSHAAADLGVLLAVWMLIR